MFLYSPRKGIHQRSSGSCPYNKGNSYTCIRWCESLPFVEHRGFAESRQAPSVLVSGSSAESAIKGGFKEETHAARWGLLRGYSGKATKWVDFVVTDSTRRESCHSHRVVRNGGGVKGNSGNAGDGMGSTLGGQNPAQTATLTLDWVCGNWTNL